MTDEEVKIAIAVLTAFATGGVPSTNDLLRELQEAIEAAWNAELEQAQAKAQPAQEK